MWKIAKHTEKENNDYFRARASEWANYPLFILQSFIPILFYFTKWWYLIIGVYILNLFWVPLRYKFVNIQLLDFGWRLNKAKWAILAVTGIFLFSKHMLLEGIIAFIWPFITLILVMLSPPFDEEKISKIIIKRFSSLR
jgi:uncharacterized membrane protein (Fun14 family)